MPLIADIEFGAALGDNELARLFTTVLGVFLSSLYILIGQWFVCAGFSVHVDDSRVFVLLT